jgi:hypothetical protein
MGDSTLATLIDLVRACPDDKTRLLGRLFVAPALHAIFAEIKERGGRAVPPGVRTVRRESFVGSCWISLHPGERAGRTASWLRSTFWSVPSIENQTGSKVREISPIRGNARMPRKLARRADGNLLSFGVGFGVTRAAIHSRCVSACVTPIDRNVHICMGVFNPSCILHPASASSGTTLRLLSNLAPI